MFYIVSKCWFSYFFKYYIKLLVSLYLIYFKYHITENRIQFIVSNAILVLTLALRVLFYYYYLL